MTRRHDNAIAGALRATEPLGDERAWVQWSTDVRAVADVLEADNPRFERARFVYACAGGEVKR
jgi:hypothetical protein